MRILQFPLAFISIHPITQSKMSSCIGRTESKGAHHEVFQHFSSLQKSHRLLPSNLYVVLYNFKARHGDELDLKAGYKVSTSLDLHVVLSIFLFFVC